MCFSFFLAAGMNTLGLIELNRCRFHSCLSVTHTHTHRNPTGALSIWCRCLSLKPWHSIKSTISQGSVSMLLWISDAQSSPVALGIRRREKGTKQVHRRRFKGCGIEHQGPVCCRWVEFVETDIWSPHCFILLSFSQRHLLGLCLEHTTHTQARAPVVNLMSYLANEP